jgi:hypothetical protein
MLIKAKAPARILILGLAAPVLIANGLVVSIASLERGGDTQLVLLGVLCTLVALPLTRFTRRLFDWTR